MYSVIGGVVSNLVNMILMSSEGNAYGTIRI